MVKKQIRVDTYKRVKNGKEESVRSHDKNVNIRPQLNDRELKRIKKGKAHHLTNGNKREFKRYNDILTNAKSERKLKELLENPLGSGEFSDAFRIGNLVLKRNRDKSLYNPQNWKEKSFLPFSQKEMVSEVLTHEALKDQYDDILPKFMEGHEIGEHYYLLREFGEIPIEPTQYDERRKELIEQYPKIDPKEFDEIRIMFPKWVEGSVSRNKYNEFTSRLYEIARDKGTFCDYIQPALRENGDLFIADLGHFKDRRSIANMRMYREEPKEEDMNYETYGELSQRLKRLDEQLGMTHDKPDFICDFYINYFGERARRTSIPYFKRMSVKSIKKWRKLKNLKK